MQVNDFGSLIFALFDELNKRAVHNRGFIRDCCLLDFMLITRLFELLLNASACSYKMLQSKMNTLNNSLYMELDKK